MRIVHVFIKEHKALRDLNVRFDGGVYCQYQNDRLEISSVCRSGDYYKGQFLSAIIGPNGVGKSSVLNFIELLTSQTDSSGFVVFFDESVEFYHVCCMNFPYINKSKVTSDSRLDIIEDPRAFIRKNNINFVKINNLSGSQDILNFSKERGARNVRDLSIERSVLGASNRKLYFSKLLSYFQNAFHNDHVLEGVSFEFTFSNSSKSILERAMEVKLDINKAYLSVLTDWGNNFYGKDKREGYNSPFQPIVNKNALSIISEISKSFNENENFILACMVYEFVSLEMQDNYALSTSNMLRMAARSLQKYEVEYRERNIKSEGNETQKHNYKLDGEGEFGFIELDSAIERLEDILNVFENISNVIIDHVYFDDYHDFKRIEIDDYNSIELLANSINNLPSSIATNFKWGWRGISSGELARIHIFSETYNYLKGTDLRDNNIILMDEVDLYFHPEWQRKFIHEYLYHLLFIEGSYGIRKPQIIMCTHSPIIISDLLPEDIVSLRKNTNDEIEVVGSVGFGNSISDIYMDGMHLESTFGEHARMNIMRLFNLPEGQQRSQADIDLIEKIPSENIRNLLLNHD